VEERALPLDKLEARLTSQQLRRFLKLMRCTVDESRMVYYRRLLLWMLNDKED
jgi:hypothetical protein